MVPQAFWISITVIKNSKRDGVQNNDKYYYTLENSKHYYFLHSLLWFDSLNQYLPKTKVVRQYTKGFRVVLISSWGLFFILRSVIITWRITALLLTLRLFQTDFLLISIRELINLNSERFESHKGNYLIENCLISKRQIVSLKWWRNQVSRIVLKNDWNFFLINKIFLRPQLTSYFVRPHRTVDRISQVSMVCSWISLITIVKLSS